MLEAKVWTRGHLVSVAVRPPGQISSYVVDRLRRTLCRIVSKSPGVMSNSVYGGLVQNNTSIEEDKMTAGALAGLITMFVVVACIGAVACMMSRKPREPGESYENSSRETWQQREPVEHRELSHTLEPSDTEFPRRLADTKAEGKNANSGAWRSLNADNIETLQRELELQNRDSADDGDV